MNHIVKIHSLLLLTLALAACAEPSVAPVEGITARLTLDTPSELAVGDAGAGGRLRIRGALSNHATVRRLTYAVNATPERTYDGSLGGSEGRFELTVDALPRGTHRVVLRVYGEQGVAHTSDPIVVHVLPALRELAVPANAAHAFPSDINARGDVSGYWSDGSGSWHAFLFVDGQTRTLGAPGEWRSAAPSLNDAGEVVGYVVEQPLGAPRPVIWRDGTMQPLPASEGVATAINDAGMVAGAVPAADGIPRAVVWRNGVLEQVGEPGRLSGMRAINAQGVVVGTSHGLAGDSHGFVYAAGRLTPLPSLGGDQSSAESINDAGTVVGYSETADQRAFHAFVFRDGRLHALPGMSGTIVASYAYDIERSGAIVGELIDVRDGIALNRGFIHVAGRTMLLDDLLGLTTHSIVGAYGINDRGEIAAAAVARNDPLGRIRPAVLVLPGGIAVATPTIPQLRADARTRYAAAHREVLDAYRVVRERVN